MTTTTELQLLAGARQCFFTHGFRASTMTLISEYAGFSRATVHKHFKNKDDAFRQVCWQFQQQANDACAPIMANAENCWDAITLIMQAWLKPTFDEVSDQRILNDLKYHLQHVAKDIFTQARQAIEDMMTILLTKGTLTGEVNLSASGISERMMAKVLLASLDGLRGHFEKSDLEQASHQLIHLFKLAAR